MILPKGTSLSDFCIRLAAFTKYLVEAASKKEKVPAPSLKTPPNNINPKAYEKYWKEFVKKYEAVWSKYKKDIDKQWACCVAIWVNYAVKRKIQPFDTTATQVSQDAKDKLEARVRGARESQLKVLDTLLSRGSRMGVIVKFLKETFLGVEEKKPGVFTIKTQRLVKFEKGIEWDSKDFKSFMAKSNFQRKYGRYVREVKTNTFLSFALDIESERPVVLCINILTKPHIEMILGMSSEKGNKDLLKKGISKYWKSMMRELP